MLGNPYTLLNKFPSIIYLPHLCIPSLSCAPLCCLSLKPSGSLSYAPPPYKLPPTFSYFSAAHLSYLSLSQILKMSSFKPLSFFNLSFFLLLLLLLSLSDAENVPARDPKSSNNLLRISCLHARYPALCLRSLSAYAASAKTPTDLAHAAVSVCLSGTQNATGFLSRTGTGARRGSRRERGALKDCIEQLSDSVDELDQTLRELRHLRSGTFRWQLSNAETWVSAALTNEDTCLDGFAGVDGSVKAAVRRKIARVARLTSNALYLINRLASTRP